MLNLQAQIALMLKAGDYLKSLDLVQEENYKGFNKADWSRWSLYRGNPVLMRECLRKYVKTQLEAVFGEEINQVQWTNEKGAVESEIARFKKEREENAMRAAEERARERQATKEAKIGKPRIEILLNANLTDLEQPIINLEFILAGPRLDYTAFNSFRDINKKYELVFRNGVNVLTLQYLSTFNYAGYRTEMEKIGLQVSSLPEMSAEIQALIQKHAVDRNSIEYIISGIKERKIYGKAVIVFRDGVFQVWSPYSPELVNGYRSMKKVMRWNPVDKVWTAGDIDTINECLNVIKETQPNWEIISPDLDRVIAELNARTEAARQPIPELEALMREGFKPFPYQNEGIRFLCNTKTTSWCSTTFLGRPLTCARLKTALIALARPARSTSTGCVPRATSSTSMCRT